MEKLHNTMEKIHSTKDKILKLLLENKEREFTIRAVSKQILVDYKSVHITVKRLITSNVIIAKKAGQTILCSLNKKSFNADIFKAEEIRKDELLRNKDLFVLHNHFKDINDPFFILLLFGSYASKDQRKGSDIDLMLITESDNLTKIAKKIISLIPLNIHFLYFNTENYLSMLRTTKFNVGRESQKNNIILFGIEDYYRLLQNI